MPSSVFLLSYRNMIFNQSACTFSKACFLISNNQDTINVSDETILYFILCLVHSINFLPIVAKSFPNDLFLLLVMIQPTGAK